ncbi:serine hydrolase domain-containing protein [Actinokineospora sp. 24-640]
MGELRQWLDGRVGRHEFSGVVLVWRDGAPVFSYAGGTAHRGHGVPVREDTRFAVASVTKMVTAAAALKLVERGALGLRQPLVEILPEEHRPAALTDRHTLHHLLSHTSGLTNYFDDEDETHDSFIACWDRVPTYHIRRAADMLPLFADLPAQSEPGERYQYSDVNFLLAGLVIEAVTGKPYAEVVAAEVLSPAGMSDSAFDALDEDPVRLATGYLHSDAPYETWRSNIFSVTATGMPDGGMITTAPDLARLVDAILGDTLVGADLRGQMTRPQGPPSDDDEQYGYGMLLNLDDGEVAVLGHGGGDPGVSAVVAHHRAAATTVVVISNHDRGAWAAYLGTTQEFGLRDPRA